MSFATSFIVSGIIKLTSILLFLHANIHQECITTAPQIAKRFGLTKKAASISAGGFKGLRVTNIEKGPSRGDYNKSRRDHGSSRACLAGRSSTHVLHSHYQRWSRSSILDTRNSDSAHNGRDDDDGGGDHGTHDYDDACDGDAYAVTNDDDLHKIQEWKQKDTPSWEPWCSMPVSRRSMKFS